MANEIDYQKLEGKTYWTLSELCAYTGYTKSYIYKLTSSNAISYNKLRGKNMFRKEDIFNLFQKGRVKSNEELENLI